MATPSVLEYKWILTICFSLIVPLTFLSEFIGREELVIAAFTIVPFILLAMFSLQSMVYLLVLSLFIHANYLYVTPGAYCSILFLISFLITRRELSFSEFQTPLTFPFFAYCLSVLPSFVNAFQPIKNIAMLHNLFVFSVVLFIAPVIFTNQDMIKKAVHFYLFLVLLNSFNVIAEAIETSKRAFGFAGIMFVDYVGTGLIIATVLALTSKGNKSFFYYALIGVFSIAMILTQTRGVWLVTFITLSLMMLYLLLRGREMGINRRVVWAFCLIAGTFILVIYSVTTNLNPEISKRAGEIVENKLPAVNEEGLASNSFITRVLVWSTAYNAFVAHPIVGIGVYGFPFSSKQYNSLPKILFNRYVKGLTPHIGYLAVVTETGIVGLLGFVIFVLAALKIVFQSISLISTGNDAKWPVVFAWVFVYMVISMFTTDAWLWGQGIVLMGLVLGLALANERLLRKAQSRQQQ